MSLIVCVICPDGLVLAADSMSLVESKSRKRFASKGRITGFSQLANKIFVSDNNVAVANIGLGTIAGKHINTFLSELTEEHPGLDAKAMAELLMKEIRTTKPVTDVTLYVADLKTLYVVDLQEDKIDEYTNYGAHWEGVTDIMDRLVGRDIAYKGRTKYVRFKNPPILFDVFNLQSAVNFAVLGIETTYRLMSLQDRVQSVGPPIDVLAITREGARWIAKKEVRV